MLSVTLWIVRFRRQKLHLAQWGLNLRPLYLAYVGGGFGGVHIRCALLVVLEQRIISER